MAGGTVTDAGPLPKKARSTQSFANDGVTVGGRVASVLNCVVAIGLITALCTPEWSVVSPGWEGLQSSHLAGNASTRRTGNAVYGLNEYCVERAVQQWSNNLHPVCYSYAHSTSTGTSTSTGRCTTPTAGNTSATDAGAVPRALCSHSQTRNSTDDRFSTHGLGDGGQLPELEATANTVQILGWAAVAASVLGGAFSEKQLLLGVLQLVSAGCAMAAWCIWLVWQRDAHGELGRSAHVFIAAALLALVSSLVGICASFSEERVTTDGKVKGKVKGKDKGSLKHAIKTKLSVNCGTNIVDDGITVAGRAGSCLSIATWALVLLAVLSPSWSTTRDLGSAGGFCASDTGGTCTQREATFGLFRYCVDEEVHVIGTDGQSVEAHTEKICVMWDDAITISNDTAGAKDGIERFGAAGARLTTASLLTGAMLMAIAADIISEKLLLCCILLLLEAVCAAACNVLWHQFQQHIGTDTSMMDMDVGSALVVAPAATGLVASALYFHNWDWHRVTKGGKDAFILCSSCHSHSHSHIRDPSPAPCKKDSGVSHTSNTDTVITIRNGDGPAITLSIPDGTTI